MLRHIALFYVGLMKFHPNQFGGNFNPIKNIKRKHVGDKKLRSPLIFYLKI